MIVRLVKEGTFAVLEADNLRELAVVVDEDMAPEDAARQLAQLGVIDGTHAWLDIEALAGAVRPAARADGWDGEYRAMIEYASSKGWTNHDATQVRAHIETTGHGAADPAGPA